MIVYAGQTGEVLPEQLGIAMGEPDPEVIEGGIMQAAAVLAKRAKPPQFLVIDIGERDEGVIAEIDALAEHCDTSVRVVVAGRINDVAFYRALRSRGILEYFSYPVQVTELREVLRQQSLVKPAGGRAASMEGVTIAFMSAASGDGSSTVALNTAYCLARDTGKPTVIVDMDYQFGMVARHCDISAPFGIRELIEYPDRGVDGTLIAKMLYPYSENLKVIAAPNDLRRMPAVSASLIRDMIAVLKTEFAYVIIDVPHIWADWTAAILAQANHQVIVSQLWLRSLTHLTRLLNVWQDVGINRSDITLVVNRSGAKFKEALTSEDVERISNKSIDLYLANDIKAVVDAENQGKTILETSNTLLARQLSDLTRLLLTRTGGQAESSARGVQDKTKKSLFSRGKK